MQKIPQTQGLFAVFVAVGIGNAAAGRAERFSLFGKAVLLKAVLYTVPRQGNRSLVGQFQMGRADFDAAFLDGADLPGQMVKVNDHAGAQHAYNIRVQDAGGEQVQNKFALLGHNGVPGVVSALITGYDIGVFGQQVDDTALALIAPVDTGYCGQHFSFAILQICFSRGKFLLAFGLRCYYTL